jgi:hypothetical protein
VLSHWPSLADKPSLAGFSLHNNHSCTIDLAAFALSRVSWICGSGSLAGYTLKSLRLRPECLLPIRITGTPLGRGADYSERGNQSERYRRYRKVSLQISGPRYWTAMAVFEQGSHGLFRPGRCKSNEWSPDNKRSESATSSFNTLGVGGECFGSTFCEAARAARKLLETNLCFLPPVSYYPGGVLFSSCPQVDATGNFRWQAVAWTPQTPLNRRVPKSQILMPQNAWSAVHTTKSFLGRMCRVPEDHGT